VKNILSNKAFYELASNNSGRKLEQATISKFEIAEEKDHVDVTYILASSVPNGNGALFTKEELEENGSSIVNTPLIIVPSWEDGSPTGHSIEDFPKIGWDAKIIGTHIASEVIEEDGVSHLKTTARVWKIRYPEIAQTLVNLHTLGNLKFSMEASYKEQEVSGTVRTLKGVKFIGSAAVDDPANPYSYSLEVAKRKQEGGFSMNLEQALQKIGELEGELKIEKAAKVTAENTAKEIQTSLETANTTIDTLKTEVADFQKKEKEAKENELASNRLAEMEKYITYTEEEKAAKKTVFASMDESVFNLLVETAQKNKPVQAQTEVAGLSSDTSLVIAGKGFLDGIENLD
jgi:hypothetical protein